MSWSAAEEEAAEAQQYALARAMTYEENLALTKTLMFKQTPAQLAAVDAFKGIEELARAPEPTRLLDRLITPTPVKEAAFQHIYLTAAEKAPLIPVPTYSIAQYEDVITRLVNLITPLVPYLTGKKKLKK